MNRRHDIDALRALAFGLVILYHVGMYYVADWAWHLKSPHAAAWLQLPMRALNLWRMDLVFLVSGVSLALLWGRAPPWMLLRDRSVRLLLPLAFGMVVVVPYQPYAQAVANGAVPPGFGAFLLRYFQGGPWPAGAFDGWQVGVTWNHLWYLPYLWCYTAVLVLAAPLAASGPGRRLGDGFRRLRGPWLLVLPALPLMLASALLWRRFPVTHDLVGDGWLHAASFTFFLYGWWLGLDAALWTELRRLRRRALLLALVLLGVVLVARGLVSSPAARLAVRLLADADAWCAVATVLGWAHHALNRPWRWLHWATESVYPWYLLHQTVIIVLVTWLAPWTLGPVREPLLLLAGTVAGCWMLTAVVRRSSVLRPLFGLRRRAPPRCPSTAQPAPPAAHSA
ncbi:MAG TPA: acyltransferase family protein [Ramlibacter sp.]|jgi:peptidoglycan/LPS O-acetylase OafA/YrhL|uniref:acyltransferase family protein n=1 Tax=Ramlibacter sp. TaxID=1917967 RepID=UPI002D3CFCDA|nr:acyltransferase family protein [Ramlibacter sp.]HZY17350.1 acyltransferase family protein [Ramlibacter sp.]